MILGRLRYKVLPSIKRVTSGCGTHPKCFALTLQWCPHFDGFIDSDIVCWIYQGEGLGLTPQFMGPPQVDDNAVPATRKEFIKFLKTYSEDADHETS